MAAIGDLPGQEVTTRAVEDLLRSIATTGVAPRTVNKARQLVCAVFNYAMRPSTYGLTVNPAARADRRAEPQPGPVEFYSPEQVEALARALTAGLPSRPKARRDH
jgi:integrase